MTAAAALPGRIRSRYSAFVVLAWLLRSGVYVVIGVDAFYTPPEGTAGLTANIIAYSLAGALMAVWALIDAAGWGRRLLRRQLPLVLGVMVVTSGAACSFANSGDMLGLAILGVVSAGSECSLRESWTVALTGAFTIAVGAVANDAGRWITVGYPLFLLTALLAGINRRGYRVQAEQSAAMLAQVEQLRAEQRQVAVLDERTRIAREIHDVLAHSLGALGIQIQAARALLTDHQDTDRAVEVLTVAQRMAAEGLTETRRAVHALRSDVRPLDQELSRMTESHRRNHQAEVRLAVDGDPVVLPADQTVSLVRTAQESLTNAAKHAPAQPVDVTIRYSPRDVTLTVSNPLGRPRPGGAPRLSTVDGGYGLTGMRERILLLGGTLTADEESGRWVVTARVPR